MEDILEDGPFDDFMLKRLTRYPNTHNTSPLTYYPQRHVLSCYRKENAVKVIPLFERSVELMERINRMENRGNRLVATDDPTQVYLRIFTGSNGKEAPANEPDRLLNSAMIRCMKEVSEDLKSIEKENPGCFGISKMASMRSEQKLTIISLLSPSFSLWRRLCEIRNQIQYRHFLQIPADDAAPLEIPGYRIYINNELLFFVNRAGERRITLLNYDQFVMLVDTLSCRVMCRLACLINDATQIEDLPSHHLICKIYQWGDNLIEESGMHAYAVIAEYETILTSAFVNFPGSDPLGLGLNFNELLVETASEVEGEFGISTDWLHGIQGLLGSVVSPNILSELFGLRKHWGNPMVCAKASGRAVQDKLDERLPLDGVALANLVASFNRMITIEFMKKNGKWPECEFLDSAKDTPLYKAWLSKSIKIDESSESHSHLHWSSLVFDCNCVLDEYYDQASYLNDKSVSVYRNHLDVLYVRALHPPAQKLKVPEERRLLLEFLRRDHMPILEIFKTIMEGRVPKEWLCNSASMKGTEMKYLKARIFAVLPYELRQYFSVSEDAIKEHIFKYNPHQTMTMKEGDLIQRLKSVTEQLCVQGSGRELNVIHIIDFSKWNLRMRYENTCGVFRSIDNFMGTPGLIEASHHLFEGMLNVVQDPFNPPDCPVEDANTDTIWRLHDSGWEGQRQKGWTAVTSAVLSHLELLTGISSTICGQGDNQVLLSKFPVPEGFADAQDWIDRDPKGAKQILDDYYEVLGVECEKIGLKVKTAETCRSLSYLNYGKRLFFNGIELSMSLKRISKMMTEPNDSFPSTEARMKTVEGSIYAAGMYSHPGALHYLISRIGTFVALRESYTQNPLLLERTKEFKFVSSDGISSRMLEDIMKIPSSFGGPPQLPLPTYLTRGHPDPLSADLIMVVFRARNGDVFSQKLIAAVQKQAWYNELDGNMESLIHAPYSLNLKTPASASKPLEKVVNRAVASYCRNSDIKELFGADVESQGKVLIEGLLKLQPFHPLIANDVYGRSLPGRRKAFLSGFTNATSMSRIVHDSLHTPLVEKVMELEWAQLIHWVKIWMEVIAEDPLPIDLIESHHVVARRCRELSWGIVVEGVTVPHPLEQFKLIQSPYDACATCTNVEEEHIVYSIHSEKLTRVPCETGGGISLMRSHGASPYLGNVVSEGVIGIDLNCVNPNSAWNDVRRTVIISRWVARDDENLKSFLTQVIRSRTDLPDDVLERAAGNPSRLSYNHRAALMSVARSSAPCCTTNTFTRFYISSNRMGVYSHGDQNYHMTFGPAFIVHQTLLSWKMIVDPAKYQEECSLRDVYHAHVRQADVPVVYDGQLKLSSHVQLPVCKSPRLLYAYSSRLIFKDLAGNFQDKLWAKPETANLEECKLLYGHQLIANSLVSELVAHEIMSLEGRSGYPARHGVISIGDIAIIGVDRLITTIAMNLLLMLPYRILCSSGRVSFTSSTANFVSKLSSGFWSNFTGPISNSKMLRAIITKNNHFSHLVGAKTQSIEEPLKSLVVSEIYRLWRTINSDIIMATSSTRLVIAAPSVSAAKALIGRYFEICFCGLHQFGGMFVDDLVSHSRDIVANLHTASEDNLGIAVALCSRQFTKRARKLTGNMTCRVPPFRLFSLREPWIDILRTATPQYVATDDGLVFVTHLRGLKGFLSQVVTLQLPSNPLFSQAEECRCLTRKEYVNFRSENYFMPNSCISKIPYGFMEIVGKFRLDVQGVVFLDSKSGSEAACLTCLDDNEWVYVHNSSLLSDFSPHQAASHVPPAFLIDGIVGKLVNPNRASVGCTDLERVETVMHVFTQLEGRGASGIFLSSALSVLDAKEKIQIHLCHVLYLAELISSVKWLMMRVKVNCHHEVQTLFTFLGRLFSVIRLIGSVFSSAKDEIFWVLCEKRKSNVVPTVSQPSKSDLVIYNMQTESRIKQLIDSQKAAMFPPSFGVPVGQLMVCAGNINHLQSSFLFSCSAYLPGWVPSDDGEVVSCDVAIGQLLEIRSSILAEVDDIIRSVTRIQHGLSVVRSAALMISSKEGKADLQALSLKWLNCCLLLKILTKSPQSITTVMSLLREEFSRPQFLISRLGRIEVPKAAEDFCDSSSGYLFEILGHLWCHKGLPAISTEGIVYHSLRLGLSYSEYPAESILSMTFLNHLSTPSELWKWDFRAFVIGLLLIRLLEGDEKSFNLISPFNHLINQEVRQRLGLGGLNVVGKATKVPTIAWVMSSSAEVQVETGSWVMIDQSSYPRMAKVYKVLEALFLPWSGVVPSRVLLKLEPGFFPSLPLMYPDLHDVSCRINEEGVKLMGCKCWSCVAEVTICDKLGISNSAMEDVISRGPPGSLLNSRARDSKKAVRFQRLT